MKIQDSSTQKVSCRVFLSHKLFFIYFSLDLGFTDMHHPLYRRALGGSLVTQSSTILPSSTSGVLQRLKFLVTSTNTRNQTSSAQSRLLHQQQQPAKKNSKNVRSKVVGSAKEALTDDCIFPGARIHCGSFGLGGLPETLLNELARTDRDTDTDTDHVKDLTVVSLTASIDGFGIGKLVEAGKVKRLVSSYVGENDHVAEMYFGGKLEVELIPQGTIAARMRAAGSGIPAFYTPAGAGEFIL